MATLSRGCKPRISKEGQNFVRVRVNDILHLKKKKKVRFPYNPIHYLCMYALLFCFGSSIVLAFVSVLRMVCITNMRLHGNLSEEYSK